MARPNGLPGDQSRNQRDQYNDSHHLALAFRLCSYMFMIWVLSERWRGNAEKGAVFLGGGGGGERQQRVVRRQRHLLEQYTKLLHC